MIIIDRDTYQRPEPSVAAIGFFDGVHTGHRFLIDQVERLARLNALSSQLITFPVHPRKILDSSYIPALLTTCSEKTSLISQTGIQYCALLDFTPELSLFTAREFMSRILQDKYNVRCLVIGYDHRFGHNRTESFDDYKEYGKELGIDVVLAEASSINNVFVSSSIIRTNLINGAINKANTYLGYQYFLNGTVVDGFKVGRTIGFPTANIRISDSDKLIPADGVYAVSVRLKDGLYKGMMNIGHRPTIDNGENRSLEVHILDFDEDIYECPIFISFVERIRSEKKFPRVEDLIHQLHVDLETVKQIIS